MEALESLDGGMKEIGGGGVCVLQTEDWGEPEEEEADEASSEASSSDEDGDSDSDGNENDDYSPTPSDRRYAHTLLTYLQTLPSTIPSLTLHYERSPAAPLVRRWRHVKSLLTTNLPSLSLQTYDTNTLVPLTTYLSGKAGQLPGALPASYGSFCKVFAKCDVEPAMPATAELPPLPEELRPKGERVGRK